MAKNDGDIIDFLMKTVFQIFGWIFMGIFKLLWWILSAIFKGIASLFHKSDKPEIVETAKDSETKN